MNYLKQKNGVYLITNIHSDKLIHKVGSSKSLYTRIKSGYLDPHILCIGITENFKDIEKIIIKEFIKNFGNPVLNKNEYFKCNTEDAINLFLNTLQEFTNFKYIINDENIKIIEQVNICFYKKSQKVTLDHSELNTCRLFDSMLYKNSNSVERVCNNSSVNNVNYICERCGYCSNKKSNLLNHLNRKKICKNILSDISIEQIKDDIENNVKIEKLYDCKKCNKIFQSRQGKYKHELKCKNNNEQNNNELLNKINDLQKEIDILKKNSKFNTD